MTTHSSQEETLAGGVPNVHGLHGHRIHRTSKAAKKRKPTGQPVLHQRRGPSLLGRVPCCNATARSSLLHTAALWHWKVSCIACAHQGYRLDYLQGQGRLTRPPRDGSLRIHPRPGPSGGTDRTKSIVLAGCLLPDGSPSETETH
jgi:hypothetical protein